jgi:hypothetical protein
MKEEYAFTLDPNQMCLQQERRNLKNIYRQLRSPSARSVFRQLTHLYFQSLCKPMPRSSVIIGVCQINREQLEHAVMFGERLRIYTVGLLIFSRDITPRLIEDSIQSIKVFGLVKADTAIRSSIKGKLR